MFNYYKILYKIGIILFSFLFLTGLLTVVGAAAQEGEPTLGEEALPMAPLRSPEAFLHQFDSLMKKQNLPPEAAGLFQVALELMHTAATDKNPGAVREKSRDLFQRLEGLTADQPMPPEVAGIFKSFHQVLQSPASSPTAP